MKNLALIEYRKLTKLYKNVPALNGIDLDIPAGRIVGLLGPNGSGKTTLIKLTVGLLTPTAGTVMIDGFAPGPQTKAITAYLPERSYMSEWMTVSAFVSYFADFYSDFDKNKAYEMLSRLGIDPKRTLKTLSKGTKEKVQLVLVMSRAAKVYFLDEPIAGVDPAARDYILNTIIRNYSENASVVISTHLISDIENVLDDAVFLRNGQVILADSADNIREKSGKSVDMLFREVFRC
ncbi:MAG: ABC transporter ATP-binding protein [Clostridia bacterium]|nr:ABC transporter ATP-binding protein [Clostridia bacterium]